MKVLEVGHISWKIKCKSCASKLEYEPADIQIDNNFEETTSYIVCPICNTKISISTEGKFLGVRPEE